MIGVYVGFITLVLYFEALGQVFGWIFGLSRDPKSLTFRGTMMMMICVGTVCNIIIFCEWACKEGTRCYIGRRAEKAKKSERSDDIA